MIWADGESEQGDNHASFKLSSGGETVALYDTDGTTLVDSIELGEQATDVTCWAYSRRRRNHRRRASRRRRLVLPTPPLATRISRRPPTRVALTPAQAADTISFRRRHGFWDTDGTIATYAWDLDYDGEYDDAIR